MKVFITGAHGFIGRTLTERYRSEGHEVVGVDSQADGSDGVVAGDISQAGDWQAAAAGCDLAINTAAIVSNNADEGLMWQVNVLGVRRVVDAAVAGDVPRMVHISSVRAFSDLGFPDGVDESWPVRTDGHRYVDTKVASEAVALAAHGAGEVAMTVIRPADVYGPGSLPWTIWPATGIPVRGFVLPIEGGTFSPVFVENLVDGLTLAAGDAGIGHVFTIGDGIGVENADFFGHYARMTGSELPLLPSDEAAQVLEDVGIGADTVDYFRRQGTYSIDKARRLLGYEPAIAVDEGMERTERWLRDAGLVG